MLVVFGDPRIKVGLQLVDRTIHLLAEGDTVEFVENGFVEAFADAIGLRALGLRARVIDILDREVEFILVPLRVTAILATPVG